jgi:hypothetical protein
VLGKEISENAARFPESEGHEFIENIRIVRMKELKDGSYKVYFRYVKSYISSHRLYEDRIRQPKTGFIRINETLQIQEVGDWLEADLRE